MTVNSVRLIKAPGYSNDLHCHEPGNFVASVYAVGFYALK